MAKKRRTVRRKASRTKRRSRASKTVRIVIGHAATKRRKVARTVRF